MTTQLLEIAPLKVVKYSTAVRFRDFFPGIFSILFQGINKWWLLVYDLFL